MFMYAYSQTDSETNTRASEYMCVYLPQFTLSFDVYGHVVRPVS